MSHEDDQEFERNWWGDCLMTFGEELKQTVYAAKMELKAIDHYGHWPVYDLEGKNVLDIGGGPCSMLLKTINRGDHCIVIDPCRYPQWTAQRYHEGGIAVLRQPGELPYRGPNPDEVWIYNVLQHVQDPALILANARASLKPNGVIRLFEWIDLPAHEGHPHELTARGLQRWLQDFGTVEELNESGCTGRAFYGVFS